MRDGWRDVQLGDVAHRRSDFTPVAAADEYRIVGVQRSGWGLVDREPTRGDSMKFDKLMELHTDDLVYRTITAFEAPSTVVAPEFEGSFVTPSTFPVYSLERSQVLPGYMRLLTSWPMFHEEMSTRCVGTVLRRKTLSKGAFESIPIALPPLSEQRRIVDLIGSVDGAIETADREALASAELLAALRRAVVTGQGEPVHSLGDYVTFAGGVAFPTSYQGKARGEIPFLKVSDMNAPGNESLMEYSANWISSEDQKAIGAKSWPAGTVIFPKVGAALATEKRRVLTVPSCFDNNIMGLIAINGLLAEYLMLFMETVRLGDMAQPGAVPSINQSHVKSLPIAVPDMADQLVIVTQCGAIRASWDAARAHSAALRALRSNLLTALLSGEHEIPSSYDRLLNLDAEAAA